MRERSWADNFLDRSLTVAARKAQGGSAREKRTTSARRSIRKRTTTPGAEGSPQEQSGAANRHVSFRTKDFAVSGRNHTKRHPGHQASARLAKQRVDSTEDNQVQLAGVSLLGNSVDAVGIGQLSNLPIRQGCPKVGWVPNLSFRPWRSEGGLAAKRSRRRAPWDPVD